MQGQFGGGRSRDEGNDARLVVAKEVGTKWMSVGTLGRRGSESREAKIDRRPLLRASSHIVRIVWQENCFELPPNARALPL
jgi:hypothetical protein